MKFVLLPFGLYLRFFSWVPRYRWFSFWFPQSFSRSSSLPASKVQFCLPTAARLSQCYTKINVSFTQNNPNICLHSNSPTSVSALLLTMCLHAFCWVWIVFKTVLVIFGLNWYCDSCGLHSEGKLLVGYWQHSFGGMHHLLFTSLLGFSQGLHLLSVLLGVVVIGDAIRLVVVEVLASVLVLLLVLLSFHFIIRII